MSKDFIIYDKASGEIVTMGTMPDPTIYPMEDGQAMIIGRLADRKTHRVSADGRVIRKRAAIIEDAESTTILLPGDTARLGQGGHLMIAINQAL